MGKKSTKDKLELKWENTDTYKLYYKPYEYVTKLPPTKAIYEHAKAVNKTVILTKKLFLAFMNEDFDKAEELHPKVRLAEFKADNIKSIIRDKSPRRFFSALTKDDMHTFLSELDAVADSAEHLADLLVARNTVFPSEIKAEFKKHLQIVECSVGLLLDVIKDLETLVKRIFRKKDVDKVLEKLHRVGIAEHEADKIKVKLRKMIYNLKDHDMIAIYHMLKIIEYADRIADHAENVEGRIRIIIQQQ